jgi:hypothetical protein
MKLLLVKQEHYKKKIRMTNLVVTIKTKKDDIYYNQLFDQSLLKVIISA